MYIKETMVVVFRQMGLTHSHIITTGVLGGALLEHTYVPLKEKEPSRL